MSKSISVGYEMYRSVIEDNVKLRDKLDAAGEINEKLMQEIDLLKFHLNNTDKALLSFGEENKELFKEIDLLKFQLQGADEARKLLAEENKELYQKFHNEKMSHTYTKARIVYAEHILNGDRDEHVKKYLDEKNK